MRHLVTLLAAASLACFAATAVGSPSDSDFIPYSEVGHVSTSVTVGLQPAP